jgi:Caspase domain
MRVFLVIAVFLSAVISSREPAAAQTTQASADPLRHGHALLIGNSHYRAWPQLVDVPLQLDELAKGLKSHFDTVEVVKDLDTDQLRQKINGFLRSYGNDSNARLLIYYAGRAAAGHNLSAGAHRYGRRRSGRHRNGADQSRLHLAANTARLLDMLDVRDAGKTGKYRLMKARYCSTVWFRSASNKVSVVCGGMNSR